MARIALLLGCLLLTTAVFGQADIRPYTPDENTLLLYHFDGDGEQIADSSGNGFDATIQEGEPTRADGLIGKSLRLDEGDVVVTDATAQQLGGMDELTVEVWFKYDKKREGLRQRIVKFWEHYLISIFEGGDVYGHIYDQDATKTRLRSRSNITPEKWYHAALVWDGQIARLYINGVQETQGRMSGTVNAAPGTFQLNSAGSDYFAGEIDELRISTVARQDFPQARHFSFVELINQQALSPGAWRVMFKPSVPAGATDIHCRTEPEGLHPVDVVIEPKDTEESSEPGWLKFQRVVTQPVPAGLQEHDTILRCSLRYRLDGEEYVRSTDLPVSIAPMLPPPEREIRAAWTHFSYNPDPDAIFAAMEKAGLNTAIMRIRRGETAFYNSEVGPLSKPPDFDHTLEDAIAAAHRHNIDIHPYINCFNIGQPDSDFAQQLKEQGRWAKTWRGEDVAWLCPSFETNREIVKQGMLELVRDYDVDGIQYDFIRYANADSCYCEHCRKLFEQHIGHLVENWPEDVREGGPLEDEYLQVRAGYVTQTVRETTAAIRQIKPDVVITAAVQAQDPLRRKLEGGQDWLRWAQEGLVDALCPMNYTSGISRYEKTTAMIMEKVAGAVPVYMGIGLRSSRDVMNYPQELAAKINVVRKYNCEGFAMFAINRSPEKAERVVQPLRDTMLPGDGR